MCPFSTTVGFLKRQPVIDTLIILEWIILNKIILKCS